jgi:hypothetical protein
VETGEERRLGFIPGPAAYGLAVAPDGRSFLYSWSPADEGDIMVADGVR